MTNLILQTQRWKQFIETHHAHNNPREFIIIGLHVSWSTDTSNWAKILKYDKKVLLFNCRENKNTYFSKKEKEKKRIIPKSFSNLYSCYYL